MYEARITDKAPFGSAWCGPEVLEHGKETLIASCCRIGDCDKKVDVYCTAMPARFYTVHVPEDGYGLSTGSGMGILAAQIATAINKGMLGLTA